MRCIAISIVLLTFADISSVSAAGTCSQSAAQCRGSAGASQPSITSSCESARQSCLKTGVFVGPQSGKMWSGLKKE